MITESEHISSSSESESEHICNISGLRVSLPPALSENPDSEIDLAEVQVEHQLEKIVVAA